MPAAFPPTSRRISYDVKYIVERLNVDYVMLGGTLDQFARDYAFPDPSLVVVLDVGNVVENVQLEIWCVDQNMWEVDTHQVFPFPVRFDVCEAV